MSKTTDKIFQAETKIFRSRGGMLSTVEAIRAGIHSRDLYAIRDAKILEQLSRGLYRLAGLHWRGRGTKIDELTKFGEICRVNKVMKPYLESVQA